MSGRSVACQGAPGGGIILLGRLEFSEQPGAGAKRRLAPATAETERQDRDAALRQHDLAVSATLPLAARSYWAVSWPSRCSIVQPSDSPTKPTERAAHPVEQASARLVPSPSCEQLRSPCIRRARQCCGAPPLTRCGPAARTAAGPGGRREGHALQSTESAGSSVTIRCRCGTPRACLQAVGRDPFLDRSDDRGGIALFLGEKAARLAVGDDQAEIAGAGGVDAPGSRPRSGRRG